MYVFPLYPDKYYKKISDVGYSTSSDDLPDTDGHEGKKMNPLWSTVTSAPHSCNSAVPSLPVIARKPPPLALLARMTREQMESTLYNDIII